MSPLRVEPLEERCVPTTITPTTFADGGQGSGSLRNAVIQCNADPGDEDCTIQLLAGTYTLSIRNVGDRQENAALTGDLDVTCTVHRLIIQGQGRPRSSTGSPARDAGDNAGASAWDQRGEGFRRVVRRQIDIGAFEAQRDNPRPAPGVVEALGVDFPFGGGQPDPGRTAWWLWVVHNGPPGGSTPGELPDPGAILAVFLAGRARHDG